MKVAKRAIPVIVSLVFVVCLIGCAQKEVVSIWKSYDLEKVGGFTMTGNNLSPIKEIGTDCSSVSVRIDDYSSSKPVILHVRLEYDESNRIIADKIVVPAQNSGEEIIVSGPVKKGDNIRVFTQVFEEDGTYNPDLECELSYSYMLSK